METGLCGGGAAFSRNHSPLLFAQLYACIMFEKPYHASILILYYINIILMQYFVTPLPQLPVLDLFFFKFIFYNYFL